MNWSIGGMWRLLKCVKLKHGMKTKDEKDAKCHIHKAWTSRGLKATMNQKWKVEKIYLKILANNKWKANNENKKWRWVEKISFERK